MEENQQNTQNIPNINASGKKKKIRWLRLSLVLIVLLLIVLLIPIGSRSIGKMILDSVTGNVAGTKVVAIVDKEKITSDELDLEYNMLTDELKEKYDKDLLLRELVDEKLILIDAKKQGIKVTDSEVKEILDYASSNFPEGVTLESLVSSYGLTIKQYSERIKQQLSIKKYLDQNVMVKTVTESEAKQFFENNKHLMNTSEKVNASHILVNTLEEAEDIISSLKNGESFEKLAKEKSLDPGSKNSGGNLGFFPRGMMVKEFEDAAFSLKVGEISSPVKTQYGYHVIRLEGKQEAGEPNFEDLKSQIIQYLQSIENQKAIYEYRNNLYTQAVEDNRVKIYSS